MHFYSVRKRLADEYEEWLKQPLESGATIKDCPINVITFLEGKGCLAAEGEIDALRARAERAERERDAAVSELTRAAACASCKNDPCNGGDCCRIVSQQCQADENMEFEWEWRGVTDNAPGQQDGDGNVGEKE